MKAYIVAFSNSGVKYVIPTSEFWSFLLKQVFFWKFRKLSENFSPENCLSTNQSSIFGTVFVRKSYPFEIFADISKVSLSKSDFRSFKSCQVLSKKNWHFRHIKSLICRFRPSSPINFILLGFYCPMRNTLILSNHLV